MNARFSLLAAAVLALVSTAPAKAMTTLYKFCADSSDNTTQQDNRLVSTNAGWVINDIGADTKLGDGTYTYAFRMKNTTSVVSPTYTGGQAITKVVVGARVTNTQRVYHVAPSVGTELTKEPTLTDTREELEFVFDSHAGVTSVTITTPSGSGSSYLYDVTISTLIPLSAPTNLDSGDPGANDFTVTWDSVANASGYTVKVFDETGTVELGSLSRTPADTSATFSGLVSSTDYLVSVVALGDGTTYDNSPAATHPVTTAASTAAAPALVVANTGWTAGVAGTSAVSATLEGDIACTIASVSMSDGSSATVENGVLSWTPPAANAASSVTATFHVSHGGDSWYIDQILSVAATPAPSAPAIKLSNASRSSFDASWSASAGGPVVEYKVRAWTGRETPDDATGTLTELFSSWYSNKQLPAGWSKNGNLGQYKSAVGVNFPIQFNSSGQFLVSPVYIGNPTSLSFTAKNNSIGDGSLFTIFGSDGNPESEFKVVESFDATSFSNDTAGGVVTINLSADYRQFKFEYTSTSGNLGFGSFVVSGTDWPAADFLEGWGGAKVSVGTATSQTISNPVAGEVNWVEVTAVGPSGLETSARASISVPRVPAAVISVK